MLKAIFIISVVYLVLSFVCIAFAWFIRIRRWYWLWLFSALAGSGLGSFLAQAAGAMSSGNKSDSAGIKGAIIGFALGLFYSGICLCSIRLFRRPKKTQGS